MPSRPHDSGGRLRRAAHSIAHLTRGPPRWQRLQSPPTPATPPASILSPTPAGLDRRRQPNHRRPPPLLSSHPRTRERERGLSRRPDPSLPLTQLPLHRRHLGRPIPAAISGMQHTPHAAASTNMAGFAARGHPRPSPVAMAWDASNSGDSGWSSPTLEDARHRHGTGRHHGEETPSPQPRPKPKPLDQGIPSQVLVLFQGIPGHAGERGGPWNGRCSAPTLPAPARYYMMPCHGMEGHGSDDEHDGEAAALLLLDLLQPRQFTSDFGWWIWGNKLNKCSHHLATQARQPRAPCPKMWVCMLGDAQHVWLAPPPSSKHAKFGGGKKEASLLSSKHANFCRGNMQEEEVDQGEGEGEGEVRTSFLGSSRVYYQLPPSSKHDKFAPGRQKKESISTEQKTLDGNHGGYRPRESDTLKGCLMSIYQACLLRPSADV